MAANENKEFYDEKNGSPSASAVEQKTGHVSMFKRRLPFSLEVRQEESSFAKTKRASNADFDPIPPSKRTWNWGAYVAYWMADAWAVSNWEVGEFARLNAKSEDAELVGVVVLTWYSFFNDQSRS